CHARQAEWFGPYLWFEPEELESVRTEIRTAKAAGLQVALKMHLALDNYWKENAFLWHGMTTPLTQEEIVLWFDNYLNYVKVYAQLAEEEAVDFLVLASELNALMATLPVADWPLLIGYYLDTFKQQFARSQFRHFAEELVRQDAIPGLEAYGEPMAYYDAQQQAHEHWAQAQTAAGLEGLNARRALLDQEWRHLIEETRSYYSGKLGIAANFDNYFEVGFWEVLDFMGINAYFPLRERLTYPASPKELRQGWEGVFDEIHDFKKAQGLEALPVIFTELGFTSRRYSSLAPWNSFGYAFLDQKVVVWEQQPRDYQERALAIRALYETHCRRPELRLQGLFYWKFSTHYYHIPFEPFAICIDPASLDPAIPALLQFVGH
ncbi:MAG: hypothetical protein KDC44_02605, partial [Phaeodactylibacter sp.]|nr:hypothetical protein [Phaeodactylibacter sp.]